jgi:hypothetical protein
VQLFCLGRWSEAKWIVWLIGLRVLLRNSSWKLIVYTCTWYVLVRSLVTVGITVMLCKNEITVHVANQQCLSHLLRRANMESHNCPIRRRANMRCLAVYESQCGNSHALTYTCGPYNLSHRPICSTLSSVKESCLRYGSMQANVVPIRKKQPAE